MQFRLLKHDPNGRQKQPEANQVPGLERLLEDQRGKNSKHYERNYLLNHLELLATRPSAYPNRLAGTISRYSKSPMNQLTAMAFHIGQPWFLRW